MMKKMKIAIVTCTTKNREWLYTITNPSKETYCKKYGADYLFNNEVYYDTSCSPGWNKIRYIRENLKDYDYLMWMDDDAGFVNFDRNIFNYMVNTIEDKTLLICKDLNGINSGIMLLKNSTETKEFLDTVWNRRKEPRYIHDPRGWMEQASIIDWIAENPSKVAIGDGKIINSYDRIYCQSPINQRNSESVVLHIACGSAWKEAHKDIIRKLF